MADNAHRKRAMVGPARPSSDQLEAAAKLTAAADALRQAEEELERSAPLIGPPPPAAVAAADNATDAERLEEVERLLQPKLTPYEALKVEMDVSAADLKKRYWRLSLLVHPDKCAHPSAAEAFQTLNAALKALSDPAKRAEIDAKLAAAAEQREAEAAFKAEVEAARFRKLRADSAGNPKEGDEELLRAAAGGSASAKAKLSRDEWMTVLPPERKAGMAQTNTYFSRSEKQGRGDTSEWTDTPEQKAEKARKMYVAAQSQASLIGPAPPPPPFAAELANRTGRGDDDINSDGEQKRSHGESLVEKHRRKRLEEEKKRRKEEKRKRKEEKKQQKDAKKQRKELGGRLGEDGEWRLWDREKDLEIKPRAMQWTPTGMASGLASRFGGGSGHPGERKFL